jgi:hypothetical protein
VLAVVVALAVAGFLGYQFLWNTPERQIKATVQSFTDDYNSSNVSGMLALMCDETKSASGIPTNNGVAAALIALSGTAGLSQDGVGKTGTLTASVSDIHVTGDRASGVVTMTSSKSPNPEKDNATFAKENGGWKVCFPPDTSDNSGDNSGN